MQRPKLGFVATEPGSRLRFTINTLHSAASSVANPATVVAVSFLRSYDTMGMASASQPASRHEHILPEGCVLVSGFGWSYLEGYTLGRLWGAVQG